VQGVGGALMFPAAIAIVVATFDLHSRGRALALFFGIAGGLTAIGPIAGGYLIQWTWRAIFWINVPVAIIALVLIAISRPTTEHRPAPIDYRGLVLITGGVGLSVFGFQQSSLWGWGNAAIEVCIAVGIALLVVFYLVELRTEVPLINVRIFRNQAFLVENIILGIAMMAFIPVFFFASTYGQISLAEKATTASLLILYFFLGFVIASQIGGRMLDRGGAKRPVVLGCVLAAVGFFEWAGKRPTAGRQRQRRDDPAVHPGRLRLRDPGRALRDGRGHGGGRRRGHLRSPTRPAAGHRLRDRRRADFDGRHPRAARVTRGACLIAIITGTAAKADRWRFESKTSEVLYGRPPQN